MCGSYPTSLSLAGINTDFKCAALIYLDLSYLSDFRGRPYCQLVEELCLRRLIFGPSSRLVTVNSSPGNASIWEPELAAASRVDSGQANAPQVPASGKQRSRDHPTHVPATSPFATKKLRLSPGANGQKKDAASLLQVIGADLIELS